MPNNIKYSFFIVFIVFIFLCACQQNTIEKKYTIGFSQCCNDPWRDVMNSEMSRELTFHPEVRFEMRMSDNNSDKQVEQIREMVKKGIDLLIVSPNESKPLTAVIEEVYKSGIAVILIDRKTESELYTAYIGANNYEVGKTAGKYIGSQIKGTGHIIELQMQMTMSPAIERHKGFRDAVATIPHLKIVEELEMVNGMSDLEKHFSTTLQQHPEVNIVFGQTDLLAETAYKIAQDQDREKGIFFVGIDGIPGTGRGIQAV
jgi:ABC-type sugar transport system substrate-binding protein